MGLFSSGGLFNSDALKNAAYGNVYNLNKNENPIVAGLADPMDLSGNRAQAARDEVNTILLQSADAAQKELEDAYNSMKELYAPLEAAGAKGLAQIQQKGFTPSQTYLDSLKYGSRDISRKLRAGGRLNSAFGARQLGDFRREAAQEEVNRQYAPTLELVKTGSNAVNNVTSGGNLFGNNMSSVLSGLGAGMNASALNMGAQRQNSFNQLSNTLGGLASYFNAKPINQTYEAQPGDIPLMSAQNNY